MSVFSWLFRKKEAEIAVVSSSKIDEFLEKLITQRYESVKCGIDESFVKIDESKKELLELIGVLETKELKNKDIPAREQHLMIGNRASFIKANRFFLNSIRIPGDRSFRGTLKFAESLAMQLKLLAESSQKNYQVLTFFFATEADHARRIVSQIEAELLKIANTLNDSTNGIKDLAKLERVVQGYHTKIKLREESFESIKSHELQANELGEGRKKLESQIKGVRESKEFLRLGELQERKAAAAKNYSAILSSIEDRFSDIKKALKKYAHDIGDSKLLAGYIDSFAAGLMADEKLEIKEAIPKLKAALEDGSITLDEKRGQRAIEAITAITAEDLASLQKSAADARSSLLSAEKLISLDRTMQQINELLYRQEHLDQKIERARGEVEQSKKIIERTEPKGMLKELQEAFLESANIRVTVEDAGHT